MHYLQEIGAPQDPEPEPMPEPEEPEGWPEYSEDQDKSEEWTGWEPNSPQKTPS